MKGSYLQHANHARLANYAATRSKPQASATMPVMLESFAQIATEETLV